MPAIAEPQKKENAPSLATSNWMNSIKDIKVENPPEPDKAKAPDPNPPPAPPKPDATPEPPKADAAKSSEPPKPSAPDPKASEEKVPRTSREWESFKTIRDAKYQEYEKKIKTYESQVNDLSEKASKPVVPPDYESIKKQAEEYDKIIQQIAVENHPKFKAYYDNAISVQIGIAKQIAGSEKAAQLEKLLALPDGDYKTDQIQTLIDDLPPLQQSRIGGVLNQLDAINNERNSEIQKSRENYKILKQRESDSQATNRKNFEDAFSKAVEALKGKDGSPMYQMRDGDEAWNKEVSERIEVAKSYLFGNHAPEQLIQAAANAAAYPAALKQVMGLMEKVGQLEKQIADMTAAQPTINGQRKLETTENTTEQNQNRTVPAGSRPMEVMAGWLKNLPKPGT